MDGAGNNERQQGHRWPLCNSQLKRSRTSNNMSYDLQALRVSLEATFWYYLSCQPGNTDCRLSRRPLQADVLQRARNR